MFQWPKPRLWYRNLWLTDWFWTQNGEFWSCFGGFHKRDVPVIFMAPKSLCECYIERLDQLQLCFGGNCLKFCQIWCFDECRNQVGIRSESGRNQVGIRSESGRDQVGISRNQTTQNDEFWTQNGKLRCTSHIHCTKIIVWVLNWASRPTTIALWLKLLEMLSNLMFLPVSESGRNQVGISRNQNQQKHATTIQN